jgi:phosphoheptose isomerase
MSRFGTLRTHVAELRDALASLERQADEIEEWGGRLARLYQARGRLLAAGNGGSAAEAQHLTAELVGRFEGERRPLSAIALHAETSSVSAIGNDYGYDEVFARQVEGLGRPGDVLVAISTSGRSENVLRAAATARARGMAVVALLGPAASPLDEAAEVALHVDGDVAGLVQQGHITIGHALCGWVEQRLAAGR